jgi:hypothetical protein
MGEAKRKRLAREAALRCLDDIDLARVALAVRKLVAASSGARGVDCYNYVSYGQHLLRRLGVPAEIAVGYAAWRVGDGDGDVVAHHPSMMAGVAGAVGLNPDAMIYHAWLEVAGRIIDFSICDLPHKAALNDAADGMRTTITWSPDYLVAEKREVVSFLRVRQEHAGLFYYERVPSLEAKARAEALPSDETALGLLWMIYQNPDINVTGPANMSAMLQED